MRGSTFGLFVVLVFMLTPASPLRAQIDESPPLVTREKDRYAIHAPPRSISPAELAHRVEEITGRIVAVEQGVYERLKLESRTGLSSAELFLEIGNRVRAAGLEWHPLGESGEELFVVTDGAREEPAPPTPPAADDTGDSDPGDVTFSIVEDGVQIEDFIVGARKATGNRFILTDRASTSRKIPGPMTRTVRPQDVHRFIVDLIRPHFSVWEHQVDGARIVGIGHPTKALPFEALRVHEGEVADLISARRPFIVVELETKAIPGYVAAALAEHLMLGRRRAYDAAAIGDRKKRLVLAGATKRAAAALRTIQRLDR